MSTETNKPTDFYPPSAISLTLAQMAVEGPDLDPNRCLNLSHEQRDNMEYAARKALAESMGAVLESHGVAAAIGYGLSIYTDQDILGDAGLMEDLTAVIEGDGTAFNDILNEYCDLSDWNDMLERRDGKPEFHARS